MQAHAAQSKIEGFALSLAIQTIELLLRLKLHPGLLHFADNHFADIR